jgi:hypothetical protein
MNSAVSPELREVIGAVHYRPAVSIIMPFEPKMSLKAELTHALDLAADRVERELKDNYTPELREMVMGKLRSLIRGLNFNTHKKSIAIYVSPVFEKVLYLDIPVEERVIVDESFEIRDLVYSKKQLHKYLVLVLSQKESRMFLGNTTSFVRIISDTPEHVYAYVNEIPERVANFSDPDDRRQVMMEKFLRHIDNSLDLVLHAYPLPLFVMGTDRTMGHFKKLTRHAHSVIDYVPGNFDDAPALELKEKLVPHIADWKKVMQQTLLNQLEEAASRQKLSYGIENVWREAGNRRGRLLVVEKDFMYPAQQSPEPVQIEPLKGGYNPYSYIRDAVDDIIEKVLEYGGDVEFVDSGLLKQYDRIALVQYW